MNLVVSAMFDPGIAYLLDSLFLLFCTVSVVFHNLPEDMPLSLPALTVN